MTNDSAIPDFNSDNSVSQTDSKQSHEESAASKDDLSNQNDVEENFVHFISSSSNFNHNFDEKLDSKQTETLENSAVEETTVISEQKLDSKKIETLENSAVEETTVISSQKLDSEQTETLENSAVEETTVISEQKLDPKTESESNSTVVESNPVEQQNKDGISTDIPLLENAIAANQKIQVEIRSEEDRLVLTLPTVSEASVSEYSWSEIWQQMKLRLLAQKRFLSSKISVHLIAYDRLLDSRQLQDIADTLSELSLQLKSVGTSRRQTAIAAAGAGYSVEQLQPKTAFSFAASKTSLPPAEALYMETTVRSGVEIRHRGSVIILGDVNPGGIVVADGDILIWGRLRGVAHAGAQGNSECTIMALQMEPTQLRIANALARAPEKSPTQATAEVAYMTTQGIRITKANDFSRKSINAD
ncbi:MAG: septum site-determining protein MinC [Cyanobacteria bacterium P01_C01_bin.38]